MKLTVTFQIVIYYVNLEIYVKINITNTIDYLLMLRRLTILFYFLVK